MRDDTGRLTYTVEETAVVLGVSRSSMYELVASGVVASVRLGRRIVILRPTIEALIGCVPPSPAELAALVKRQRLRPVDTPPIELEKAKSSKRRSSSSGEPRLFG